MKSLVVLLLMCGVAGAAPRWKTAPLPPEMPAPAAKGDLAIDDFTLHWAAYGDAKAPPLVLLHGGLGSGDDFAGQVPALAARFRVIVVDSRGHGRSTRAAAGVSYHQMAGDVIALLDHLKIERAALLGWSDGGIIALDLAIHHPARTGRIVVTGTNFDRSGTKPAGKSAAFAAYTAHCVAAYRRPEELPAFRKQLRAMWKREPAFTAAQLGTIESSVLVAHAEHDEIIKRAHAERLASSIPNGKLVVLDDVSHFAIWQDPEGFNRAVLEFLLPPP
jgi:pimeloyl-ACP methyl ester carboxylesterase